MKVHESSPPSMGTIGKGSVSLTFVISFLGDIYVGSGTIGGETYQVELTDGLQAVFGDWIDYDVLIELSFDSDDQDNLVRIEADRSGNIITGTFTGQGSLSGKGTGTVTLTRS